MPEKQSPASSLFRFSFSEDLFSCPWDGQGTGTDTGGADRMGTGAPHPGMG